MTWTDALPEVADEARLTAMGRMGAVRSARSSLDAIAAFVDFTCDVDVGDPDVDASALVLGRQVFERAEVGCARCHHGPRLTDRLMHRIGNHTVDTLSLIGVAATPPYLHDGRHTSLREVLEWARDGVMGSTESLSDEEMDALEAYLGSL